MRDESSDAQSADSSVSTTVVPRARHWAASTEPMTAVETVSLTDDETAALTEAGLVAAMELYWVELLVRSMVAL